MKKAVSFLLTLAMILTLCACGAGEAAPSIPDRASSSFLGGSLGETAQPQTQTEQTASTETTLWETQPFQPGQRFSNDAGTSIDVLREEIARAGAVFGVAYIGSYFQGEMTYEEWFESAAYDLIGWYPFVSEIDAAHTIGTVGHLYCILARDYDAAITAQTLNGEVLYRAENGDPILLFCSRDGEGMISDTIVTVTTSEGAEYQWEAKLDGENYPQLLIGAERQLLSWDFTYVFDLGFELTGWLNQGWLGPTEIGLAGTDVFEGMSWWIITEDGTGTSYCLSFYPNAGSSYDGEVVMECFCGEDTQAQAHWEGWWRIDPVMDYASWLHMDLMLMDGTDKGAFETSSVISENYMTLISPSGEYLLLVADSTQTVLPLFPDRWRFCELALAMG